MNGPYKILLKPRKIPFRTSDAVLPKHLVDDRAEFLELVNELLRLCMNSCGITAKIRVGEDQGCYFAEGSCPQVSMRKVDSSTASFGKLGSLVNQTVKDFDRRVDVKFTETAECYHLAVRREEEQEP